MKKSYIYNAPKGSANDRAQMMGPSNVVHITKRTLRQVAVPVKSATDKSTEKGGES